MSRRPTVPKLAGLAEAAEILGVSKRRIQQLRKDHPDFPQPAVILAAGPIWLKYDIEQFRKIQRPRGIDLDDQMVEI